MYSSGEIGAVGAISNYAGNKQQIGVLFNTAEEYVQFGNQNNVVAKESDITRFYEERVRLCSFAMLMKRDVWNKAGGMDEDFSPGYFEDDDLSMKILRQGKRLLVCTNSFIYHAGSVGFSKNSKNILNQINIIMEISSKISYNLNLNLLFSSLIIKMGEV